MAILVFVSDGSSHVICSSALGGLHRLDFGFLREWDLFVLSRAKPLFAVSRILQFMTLLPGVAFVFVVAFLATTVALYAGLVGSPFRFRLWAFVMSLSRTFVGTGLALGGVDLHFLQAIIVVVPGGDFPWSLSVGPSLVNSFLFYLSFIEALINLERHFVHFSGRGRSSLTSGDFILDHILQSSVEMRSNGMVILASLDDSRLECSLVLGYRPLLDHGLQHSFCFHLFVAVAKRGMQLVKECSLPCHDCLSRGLAFLVFRVFQEIL